MKSPMGARRAASSMTTRSQRPVFSARSRSGRGGKGSARLSHRKSVQMPHWLVKNEPSSWSFEQQLAAGKKGTNWSGVRNHAAKLNLMAMKLGEQAFFYHSNEGKDIV